ncbi:histidinol-phosphate phosphatase family protein [Arcticibacter svalbardensis MN12-7]|uniref:D,D-heptose 1,7-bisphosphate phosphatase n=1 Tax=Arcticibacter svalbardensis MN12-7 TaxID=1150600 RepID=R9GNI1_9SPHI|nr:HAD-IIIA family hydrolase [Arcticibacter svalbardensis]EOR93273.1 histidinol-phosphate phosphatase family protein [Arcticibacter svalbardensis MN12-7]
MLDTLFLDRDGVLNKKLDDTYVLLPSDIEILPGIKDFLLWANQAFKQILVVTNQRCIGRKMLSLIELKAINEQINKQVGSVIQYFFVCPHLDEDNCNCRKPKTGLFLQAKEMYSIDFDNSWMIGDSVSDLIPARSLGIKTIYVGHHDSQMADFRVESTVQLLPSLINQG